MENKNEPKNSFIKNEVKYNINYFNLDYYQKK